ncbi:MAG: hypothetical protein LAT75_03285 [Candidatus Cyclonatronum sp.]|uniref:hypothetical protein n=1 Tax=Cyclonatronum sp. TaxID=3024185 RepID=UPI0025B844C5|nr:hypothetical protein [Cyclonatronum sp.]MCC5935536.1 hypothetical protein [Balneolales bacterium]MCH8485860.1 hypothetical protein [Cyclonatronum sp.]
MELKEEITDIVNNLPDEVLEELLQYLRQIEKSTAGKAERAANLKKIIADDRELLDKLSK